jgi:Tfp pilus assembly protein PilX
MIDIYIVFGMGWGLFMKKDSRGFILVMTLCLLLIIAILTLSMAEVTLLTLKIEGIKADSYKATAIF